MTYNNDFENEKFDTLDGFLDNLGKNIKQTNSLDQWSNLYMFLDAQPENQILNKLLTYKLVRAKALGSIAQNFL